MKRLLLLILLIISVSFIKINAQIDNNEFEFQYNKLLESLSEEKWMNADSLTTYLINKYSGIESMEHENQVLRYISIYSTAGLLSEKLISKEKALDKASKYKGLRMVMPAHPLKKDCYVNCTHLVSDQKNTFFTGVNNAQGTQIFSFEYVKMKSPVNENYIKSLEGQNISLSGLLKDITVEGNIFPRFKMQFVAGEMNVVN